jgi:hypothetical protein
MVARRAREQQPPSSPLLAFDDRSYGEEVLQVSS